MLARTASKLGRLIISRALPRIVLSQPRQITQSWDDEYGGEDSHAEQADERRSGAGGVDYSHLIDE
jgi:hypothetical protein